MKKLIKKLVKCGVCEEQIRVQGDEFFRHCGMQQPITKDNLIFPSWESLKGSNDKATMNTNIKKEGEVILGDEKPLDIQEVNTDKVVNETERLPNKVETVTADNITPQTSNTNNDNGGTDDMEDEDVKLEDIMGKDPEPEEEVTVMEAFHTCGQQVDTSMTHCPRCGEKLEFD